MTTTPQATSSSAPRDALAALLLGLAFGVAATTATALLLYTGQGLLRAAGLLVALTIGALAAGVWVGSASSPRAHGRWVTTLLLYATATLTVLFWSLRPELRAWPPATALAMLLSLALPAYATGLLLGSFSAAGVTGAGIAALGGTALGVLLATGVLIPSLAAPVILAAATTLVFWALLFDWQRAGSPGGSMSEKGVIITGVGGRGQLGFTLARHFARAGWRVLITGRSDAVHDLAVELANGGGAVSAVRADLLVEADVAAVVEAAVSRYGGIDALVNVAGGLTLIRSVEDTHVEELQQELDRNLATALAMSRAALPALRARRGAIVNFASPAAFRPVASLAAYSAAKAGVVALTRALALEEKNHGVRVNAIAPGTMDTEQNVASGDSGGQYVSRGAVADVVLFLASEGARGISGEVVMVTVVEG